MASKDEAKQAILDAIAVAAPASTGSESRARIVLNLAEAYAWLMNASQPHGGNSGSKP